MPCSSPACVVFVFFYVQEERGAYVSSGLDIIDGEFDSLFRRRLYNEVRKSMFGKSSGECFGCLGVTDFQGGDPCPGRGL